ncbi:MAG: IS1595 family transposase [Albidovulum sp.]|nr:IS1595 family transposase [Albidovulum sp.]
MKWTKLQYCDWAIAVYMLTTNLKGVSSMKLQRDLEITQKSTWHLMHRLRAAFTAGEMPQCSGPVEADETYIGGLEKNKHKKLNAGRGGVGKGIVAGVNDRGTNQVAAKVAADAEAKTPQGFVEGQTIPKAQVYTDTGGGYAGIARARESVNHSAGEYVGAMARTNGIESYWATLERGHKGVFHKFSKKHLGVAQIIANRSIRSIRAHEMDLKSLFCLPNENQTRCNKDMCQQSGLHPKHLQRYADEFAGRRNVRNRDTLDMMNGVLSGMVGKQLRYADLAADNGLDSGARS